MTETSVGKMYIAAIVPSALVCLLFFAVILVHGLRRPSKETPPRATVRERCRASSPPADVSFDPDRAWDDLWWHRDADRGRCACVVAAIVFALVARKLSFKLLQESAEATARNTSMIGLILFGAYMLNFIMTQLRVPQSMAEVVSTLPLPAWAIMLVIIGFYLALGTFMEGFSMIITTIPVVFPS